MTEQIKMEKLEKYFNALAEDVNQRLEKLEKGFDTEVWKSKVTVKDIDNFINVIEKKFEKLEKRIGFSEHTHIDDEQRQDIWKRLEKLEKNLEKYDLALSMHQIDNEKEISELKSDLTTFQTKYPYTTAFENSRKIADLKKRTKNIEDWINTFNMALENREVLRDLIIEHGTDWHKSTLDKLLKKLDEKPEPILKEYMTGSQKKAYEDEKKARRYRFKEKENLSEQDFDLGEFNELAFKLAMPPKEKPKSKGVFKYGGKDVPVEEVLDIFPKENPSEKINKAMEVFKTEEAGYIHVEKEDLKQYYEDVWFLIDWIRGNVNHILQTYRNKVLSIEKRNEEMKEKYLPRRRNSDQK